MLSELSVQALLRICELHGAGGRNKFWYLLFYFCRCAWRRTAGRIRTAVRIVVYVLFRRRLGFIEQRLTVAGRQPRLKQEEIARARSTATDQEQNDERNNDPR